MKLKAVRLALFVGCFMVLSNLSFAKIEYFNIFNGPSDLDDSANHMHVDNAGNAYVTGGSEGDILAIKYDPNGAIIWTAQFGGAPNQVEFSKGLAVDCKGYVHVSGVLDFGNNDMMVVLKYDPNGRLLTSIAYDPGTMADAPKMAMNNRRIYLVAPVDNDIVIVCFNESLVGLWQFRYDSSPSTDDWPIAIAADADNVYVAGRRSPGLNGSDFVLLKVNRQGGYVFLARTDFGDDIPTAIKVMPNQDVYMTGFSFTNGMSDIVTMKFDMNGAPIWSAIFTQSGPNHHGRSWGITTDSAGNPIVVGGLFNGVNHDFFTMKYNSAGYLMWHDIQDLGFDEEAGLVFVDACGNLKVVGQSDGNIVVLVYGPNGLLSTETVSAPFSIESPYLGDLDKDGSLFVGGIINFGSNDDYLTIKFAPQYCSSGPQKCP